MLGKVKETSFWFNSYRNHNRFLNQMEMDYLHPNYTLTFDASFFFHGIVGVLASNVLIGLPANIYVVWMIASESSSPLVSELFALNLAIAEILFSCSSFYVMVHFLLEMPWLIGVLVMKVFLQLMLVSRPLFQTCICLERYVAVVHPTLFIRYGTVADNCRQGSKNLSQFL